jgi:hypothetical protein
MEPLLTPIEIKSFKDLGKTINEDKMKPIINQAQDVDLRGFLGTVFYFDVMANLENEIYQALISGTTFEYQGVTYRQQGLKALLADLFMSRFYDQLNVNVTPFGATNKLSQNSQPTDKASLNDASQGEREMAAQKWEDIKTYLNLNSSQFPKYNIAVSTIASNERKTSFRRIL